MNPQIVLVIKAQNQAKKIFSQVQDQLKKIQGQTDQNTRSTRNWRDALSALPAARAALNKLENELRQLQSQIKDNTQESKRFTDALSNLAEARTELDRLEQGLEGVEGQTERTRRSGQRLKQGFEQLQAARKVLEKLDEDLKKVEQQLRESRADSEQFAESFTHLNTTRKAVDALRQSLKLLENQYQGTTRGNERFRRSTAALVPLMYELSQIARVATRAFFGFGLNLVKAAANFETYENSVRVFSRTQEQANERLIKLVQFSKELVGLPTGDIIKFFGRLSQLNLSDDEAIAAIRSVTQAIAEQGKGTAIARLSMEQFVQALGNVKPLQTDFRTLFREMPQLAVAIEKEFGKAARNAQEFREVLDELGLAWQDVRVRLIRALDDIVVGANIDTLNAQLDILHDQAEVTAAAFGKILLPSIIAIISKVNELLNLFQKIPDSIKAIIIGAVGGATSIAAMTFAVTASIAAWAALNLLLLNYTGLKVIPFVKAAVTRLIPVLGAMKAVLGGVLLVYGAFAIASHVFGVNIRNHTKDLKEFKEAIAQIAKTDGVKGLENQIQELEKELEGLQERLNLIRVEGAPQHLLGLNEDIKRAKVLTTAINDARKAIQDLEKQEKQRREAAERAAAVKSDLELDLVKADTTLRRVEREIRAREFKTVSERQELERRQIAALRRVATLEEKEAGDNAARIQLIRDKLVEDIADAEKDSADDIKEYEKQVFEARAQAGKAFVEVRKRQAEQRKNIERLVADANLRTTDQLLEVHKKAGEQEAKIAMLVADANARANQITIDKAKETAKRQENIDRLVVDAKIRAQKTAVENERKAGEESNRIALLVADANSRARQVQVSAEKKRDEALTAFKIENQKTEGERITAAVKGINEIRQRAADRERMGLQHRLEIYEEYYNILQQLDFRTTESFIASAIRATTAYIQQLAIRGAADKAYAEFQRISATGAGFNAALAGGLATGGTGFALAGALAIGSALITTLLLRNQQDTGRTLDSNSIFHRRANDVRLRMGVREGFSNAALDRLNNNQQAADIAVAVREGIQQGIPAIAPQSDQPMTINLQVNDRNIQTWEVRSEQMQRQRRLRNG